MYSELQAHACNCVMLTTATGHDTASGRWLTGAQLAP